MKILSERLLGILFGAFIVTIVCVVIWVAFFVMMTVISLDPIKIYSIMKIDWQVFRMLLSAITLSVFCTDLIVGGIFKNKK